MKADHDRKGRPGKGSGLAGTMTRIVTADDMTQVHDSWSPEEACESYDYGGFRLHGTTATDHGAQHVHLYCAENLTPVLSRDPSEWQLTIWLAETFVFGQAKAVIEWVQERHPEFGDLELYDVDAGRWPLSPLPASWADKSCPRVDFIRDPTFPLDTRVKAVVLNHADANRVHASIVPRLREAPTYAYSTSKRIRTRRDGGVDAFRPDGWSDAR